MFSIFLVLAVPDLKPRIYAMFAKALRGAVSMPRLVMTDLSLEAAERGDTITVPIDEEPGLGLVGDFAEGIVPGAGTSPKPTNVKINLNQYKEVEFQLGAKEVREVIDGIIPSAVRTRAISLAWWINDYLFQLAQQSPNLVVDATPFDTANSVSPLQNLTKRALELRWGGAERCLILSPNTFGAASAQSVLTDADKTGMPVGENIQTLGRQRGYLWIGDEMTRRQAAGTRKTGGSFQTGGAVAVGDSSITIDAITGVLHDGDVLSTDSAGANVVGVVAGTVAAQGVTINLHGSGALRTVGDNVDLHVQGGASMMNNIVFRKDAIMLAVRVLTDALESRGANPPVTEIDPVTGLPITMRVWEGHGVTRWSFSTLLGGALVHPNRLIRLLSTN